MAWLTGTSSEPAAITESPSTDGFTSNCASRHSIPAGTVVSWSQAYESPEVARRIEHIVVPANEQNLERLSVEVLRKPGS